MASTAPTLSPSPTIGEFRSFRHPLADGTSTEVHVAAYPRRRVTMRVVALAEPEALESWCRRAAVGDALGGGFFVTPVGTPLGELWVGGLRVPSVPFDPPSGPGRSCVTV
ncbi:MAG TPA: hypothetical protein VK951_01580, partial [Miltoncostaeaceae bacterium]|nr:hypothetical protein [Miltoncostaeaceae bacterium]